MHRTIDPVRPHLRGRGRFAEALPICCRRERRGEKGILCDDAARDRNPGSRRRRPGESLADLSLTDWCRADPGEPADGRSRTSSSRFTMGRNVQIVLKSPVCADTDPAQVPPGYPEISFRIRICQRSARFQTIHRVERQYCTSAIRAVGVLLQACIPGAETGCDIRTPRLHGVCPAPQHPLLAGRSARLYA